MSTHDRIPGREFSLPESPRRIDASVDEELRFHIDERREELIASGMSPAEAEAEVRRRFGDYDAYRRETSRIDADTLRERARARFLSSLWRESRLAVRALGRNRAFSLIAFTTLALGLGATMAMYAVLDTVVLRPLPYPDADRLVSVLHPATVPGSGERRWGISPGGYFQFRENARTVSDFGIYRNFTMTVMSGGDAEPARVASITHDIFDAFRARAELGRLIEADDDVPGGPQVVVLSHEYHQRRFGGDPKIVGSTINTADGSYQVIGVTAPGLTLPMPGPFADALNLAGFGVDLWVPMRLDPAGPFWNNHPNVGIARLKEGVTVDDATRDLAGILARFPETLSNAYSKGFLDQYAFRVEASPLRDSVLGRTVPRILWMLFAAVLIVLAIAAANVGNLFLVRGEGRRREAALRRALGAERSHMAAHHLAESLTICVASALAGVALAAGALRIVVALAPTNVPRLASVSLGWSTVLVGLGIALALGVILGVVPMLRTKGAAGALRDGGRGLSAAPAPRAVRAALVAGQLALTIVLLAGAGLMLRTSEELRNVEAGFDPSNTLVFDVSLPFNEIDTRAKAIPVHEQLQQRLRALPGVVAVGAGALPLQDFGTGCTVVWRENRPYDVGEQTPCLAGAVVLPGYFEALGIDVKGHLPTWNDVQKRTQPLVITRAAAERLWPGEDPIGKGINSNGQAYGKWFRVVGVIESIRLEALDQAPTEAAFYPATGLEEGGRSGTLNDLTIIVRTDGTDPLSLVPAARQIVRELNPGAPFVGPRLMTDVVAGSVARTSFIVTLLGLAALMALVLSAVGTYGVISYLVTQRRVEIGIRMALGASVPRVVGMVVLQTARIAAVGLVVGIAGAFAGTRLLTSFLYGVQAGDPTVFTAASALLLIVIAFASLAPARRAARVAPVEAMRGG